MRWLSLEQRQRHLASKLIVQFNRSTEILGVLYLTALDLRSFSATFLVKKIYLYDFLCDSF